VLGGGRYLLPQVERSDGFYIAETG
jgi:hypothetical protein